MNDDRDPTWAPLDPSRDPERWEAMVREIVLGPSDGDSQSITKGLQPQNLVETG